MNIINRYKFQQVCSMESKVTEVYLLLKCAIRSPHFVGSTLKVRLEVCNSCRCAIQTNKQHNYDDEAEGMTLRQPPTIHRNNPTPALH